ncbi:YibE/F family protein [Patescibacteria group bacterium]|nr:YibE/F family protein [Patescibacteria group bacterium]
MKKLIYILALSTLALLPNITTAQNSVPKDTIFKAQVIEILEETSTTLSDGITVEQQNVRLIGLENEFQNKKVDFIGIGNFDVVNKNIFKLGDTVLVAAVYDNEGNVDYYITDFVRTKSLKILFILFLITLIGVGGWKGFRSAISLAISFLIIMQFIVPEILSGSDPIIITLIGSLLIFTTSIYLTEGFKPVSHICIVSVIISLTITIAVSWFFVEIAKISGLSSEETGSLMYVGNNLIHFKGLLLTGIIIGALGVLDDVIIAQVASVEEIHNTDKTLSKKKLFDKAFRVGVSHISSMTNTLFLAYTGASLPLIVLFASGTSAFSNFGQIINNEEIATEIVRTLSGSIGLILAVPIATSVAVWWVKRTQHSERH